MLTVKIDLLPQSLSRVSEFEGKNFKISLFAYLYNSLPLGVGKIIKFAFLNSLKQGYLKHILRLYLR